MNFHTSLQAVQAPLSSDSIGVPPDFGTKNDEIAVPKNGKTRA